MARIKARDRFRYRFDRMLSRGSATAIWWVVGLSAVVALLGGLTFWVLGVEFDGRGGLVESFRQALLIVIGEGSVLNTGAAAQISTFVFVTAAVFLTGGLVGALVAAVNTRLDALRRGRSRVLESGHTVILGWSPRLMAVLDELLAENPGGKDVVAVVLADRDKTQMEDEFRARHEGVARSRVVFRSGKASARSDLEMVAAGNARSVLVLSEGGFVDAMSVRRALAAYSVVRGDVYVVSELGNARIARSLRISTDEGVVSITVREVVADMLAQAIRTRGMAEVFDEMLAFRGQELYVVPAGRAAGRRFQDVVLAVPAAVVVGLVKPDGAVMLAPTSDIEIGARDSLVVLAGSAPAVDRIGDAPKPAAIGVEADVGPLSVVVIGWSRAGPGALDRLAEYLPEGSTVNVLADVSLLADGHPEWRWSIPGSFRPTKHDPEQVLSAIDEVDADVVAVLGYADKLTEDEADALTLLTLLTFEQARREGEVGSFRTVAHLFDQDIAELVVHTGPLDFVVTDALASRMLVQASRGTANSPASSTTCSTQPDRSSILFR